MTLPALPAQWDGFPEVCTTLHYASDMRKKHIWPEMLLDRSVKGIISAKSICVYRSTHCTYIIRRIYCCILVKDHNQTLQQYYGTCKDNHHRVIFPYFRNASKNSTACFRLSGTYSPLFFYCADHSCANNQSHDSCPYISRSCQGYPFQCHRYDHQSNTAK